jgi:hypothetical protein
MRRIAVYNVDAFWTITAVRVAFRHEKTQQSDIETAKQFWRDYHA